MTNNPNQPPFIVGQQVVRKLRGRGAKSSYGAAFTVHIVEWQSGEWVVLDMYLNKFRATDCICAKTYNSPLWQAMEEGE